MRLRSVPLLAACLLPLAAPGFAQDADAPASPEAQVFVRVCGKCHPKEVATVARKAPGEWEDTVIKMIDKYGAKASDKDFGTALDYLVQNFGRVNVNRAPTRDLTLVLGWSRNQANAIVDYRRAHGDFADLDALAAVPGIEAAKVQAAKDAITF